jgi:hypothetical protein
VDGLPVGGESAALAQALRVDATHDLAVLRRAAVLPASVGCRRRTWSQLGEVTGNWLPGRSLAGQGLDLKEVLRQLSSSQLAEPS